MRYNKFSFMVLIFAIFSLWLSGCLTDPGSSGEDKKEDVVAVDTLDTDTIANIDTIPEVDTDTIANIDTIPEVDPDTIVDPDTNDVVVLGLSEFDISGEVLDDDGEPVKGAVAKLLRSGLVAITDENGVYQIKSKSGGLAKRSASDSAIEDTLLIVIPNGNGSDDSSEVTIEVVESGVVMELPATYIIQREIRGYMSPHEVENVGRIEAIVFDNAVPDQKKHIDLWHDELNKAFHSFAYFSSAKNKVYTLYVDIYDKDDNFVGRSPDFTFPDNAGNIVFADAFAYNNAFPKAEVVYSNIKTIERLEGGAVISKQGYNQGDTIILKVIASDDINFTGAGEVVSCLVDKGDGNFEEVSPSLAKKALFKTTAGEAQGYEVAVVASVPGEIYTQAKVIDSDSNVTVSEKLNVDVFSVDTSFAHTLVGEVNKNGIWMGNAMLQVKKDGKPRPVAISNVSWRIVEEGAEITNIVDVETRKMISFTLPKKVEYDSVTVIVKYFLPNGEYREASLIMPLEAVFLNPTQSPVELSDTDSLVTISLNIGGEGIVSKIEYKWLNNTLITSLDFIEGEEVQEFAIGKDPLATSVALEIRVTFESGKVLNKSWAIRYQ